MTTGPGPHVLAYDQTLVATERAISAAELIKRLKSLLDKLRELPQAPDTDTTTVQRMAAELVSEPILHHRDRGVRVLTSCCIAEVLRIFAPDAPYSPDHLDAIFHLLASQLSPSTFGLAPDANPYAVYYQQLLMSLATVQSISLLADLDDPDPLVARFVEHVLDALAPHHPAATIKFAGDLLVTIVLECPVSHDVSDKIVATLASAALGSPKHAAALAVASHADAAAHLHGHVSSAFMDTLMAAAKATHLRTPAAADDLGASTEAHARMATLYPVAPLLLAPVVPLLEEELVAEHAPFRLLAVTTLGAVLRAPATQCAPVARDVPSAWKAWCARHLDKATDVRLAWVALAADIYNMHPHLVAADLNAALARVLIDPDEKVRVAACQILGDGRIEFGSLRRYGNQTLWNALGARIRDRRGAVRLAAVKAAGSLWRQTMHVVLPTKTTEPVDEKDSTALSSTPAINPQSQSIAMPTADLLVRETNLEADELANLMRTFAWIPRDLLHSAYLNDPELNAVLENMLIEAIVHPKEKRAAGEKSALTNPDWSAAMDRLLWFLSPIRDDERAKRAFVATLQRQQVTITEMLSLVRLAEQQQQQRTGLESSSDATTSAALAAALPRVTAGMAARLPNPQEGQHVLAAFVKGYQPAWGSILRSLAEWGNRDFAAIRRGAKDALKAMTATVPGSAATLGILVRRMAPLILCHEMMPMLIERAMSSTNSTATWADDLRRTATWVLDAVTRTFPAMVARVMPELLVAVEWAPERVLAVLTHLETKDLPPALVKDLVRMASTRFELAPAIGAVLGKGNHIAACEVVIAQAAATLEVDGHVGDDDLDNDDVQQLQDLPMRRVADALGCLSKLAKSQTDLFEDHAPAVTTAALRVVVGGYLSNDPSPWLSPEQQPPNTRAQSAALGLLANRVGALAKSPRTHELAADAVAPLMKLVDTILASNGQVHPDLPPFATAALRLAAARTVFKLARYVQPDPVPEHVYLLVAQVMTDPVGPVREWIGRKLRALLAASKLSARYVPLVVLVDPTETARSAASALLKGLCCRPGGTIIATRALPRLLHTLAHILPPGVNPADIRAYAVPVDLYLDAVLRAETAPPLHAVLARIKEHEIRRPINLHREAAEEAAAAATRKRDAPRKQARIVPGADNDAAPAASSEEVKLDTDPAAAAIEEEEDDHAPLEPAITWQELVNRNLYILAEYATKVIYDKCKLHGWSRSEQGDSLSLEATQASAVAAVQSADSLPRDIFTEMDAARAREHVKVAYLESALTAIGARKSNLVGPAQQQPVVRRPTAAALSRSRPTTPAAGKGRKRGRKASEQSGSDADAAGSSDGEHEEEGEGSARKRARSAATAKDDEDASSRRKSTRLSQGPAGSGGKYRDLSDSEAEEDD